MPVQVYESIPINVQPQIQHSDTVLITVDGTRVTSNGKVLIPTQLSDIEVVDSAPDNFSSG